MNPPASNVPIVLSTWSFGPIANAPAMDLLLAGGSALDAVVAGATAVENDESIDTVGVGGYPDADGTVSLDACVMTDPDRAGSVCYLTRYPNPTAIARRVMERTIHVMLAGRGAEDFAAREGFEPHPLLTANARDAWLKWRADPANFIHHADPDNASHPSAPSRYRGWIPPRNVEERTTQPTASSPSRPDRPASHDTICILARDAHASLAGACTTSGMAFKVPGRVGDSPIIGHGLYVDQHAGAAAATGNGELVMGVCGSFLAVELMRQGRSPLHALTEVLNRIASRFRLSPDHQVAMIALRADGSWASVALRDGFHHVLTTADPGRKPTTRTDPPQLVLIPDPPSP